ncbi:AEC family transporter [Methanobacterium petrolearium]|uniref:AEC family transporter n=1 Tax=Methanobacterium petrolearium TaxID=710190 RepID=UPI001AE454D8|nr:AEC family transporter [Methanobacterium petrolearium]MBP1945864.1 auxin efflux carrier (AEC) [Methanobacterium petrolearium]BDZ69583.1 transporter [Methanobacterium petrolearium]
MNSYETILAIVVMILIGYVCRRYEFLKPEDTQTLNKIVVYIAIPALIFLAMYHADLSNIRTFGTITLICITMGIISGIIAYFFTHFKGYSAKTRWGVVTASALFNSGFLGYPVVLGVFGATGLVRAVFYDVGSTLLFISFGIFFLIRYGGSYKDIIKKSVLFPPLLAVICGVFANLLHLQLGSVITSTLNYLSGAAIPMIMISLGLSLEFKGIKEYFDVASFVSVLKLIISPMIAMVIVGLVGLSGLDRTVTIVEAGMPSAMLSLVLAVTYKLDVKVTAACIFMSTALSIITITVLILFI